jgi:hypothetical protein
LSQKDKSQKNNNNNQMCSLCMKELKHYERNKLLKCNHRAHDQCFKMRRDQQENVRPSNFGNKLFIKGSSNPECLHCNS